MTAIRNYARFARIDPLSKPDWRFRRVLELSNPQQPLRAGNRDDKWVKGARPFLLQWRAGRNVDTILAKHQDVGIAYRMFENRSSESSQTLLLECRLLSGAPIKDIAESMGTTVEAILWYTRLFYDVRPRLKAKDWILANALMPALDEVYDRENQPRGSDKIIAQGRLDPSLRVFAYIGGPALLDYMAFGAPVDVKPKTYDAVPDALDHYIKTSIRVKSTLAMQAAPVSSFNLTELVGLSVRLMEMAKDDGKNKERFLAEAVDEIMKSTPWNVSTRQSISDDEAENALNYELRPGETREKLSAPDAGGLNLRQRVVDAETELREAAKLQSGAGGG